MSYISLRELRIYTGFHPIKVENEALIGPVDGVNTVFYTVNKPVVDFDYDGAVVDDVVAKVNGSPVAVASIDPERGMLTLASPPPSGSAVTADYYWHPFGDGELTQAIEAAEAEIHAVTGQRFSQQTYTERFYVTYGNEVQLTHRPVTSVYLVRVEDAAGNGEDLASSDYVVDTSAGVVRLRKHFAGVIRPPWYTVSQFYVTVTYTAGYASIPNNIKLAALKLATYHLLQKTVTEIESEPEYQGKLVLVFKKPEDLLARLEQLRVECERVKALLPRRVDRV